MPDLPEKPGRRSRLRPYIVLVIMLVLAGGSWLVLQKLTEMSRIQDCVMSGRSNCQPVDGP